MSALAAIWRDVRFGVRTLLRSPGFALAVVLTLALGIGVNTAVFSVFDALLLRPLPFPGADRLVQIWEHDPRLGGRNTISPLNHADWREQSSNFEEISTYAFDPFTLTGHGEPRRLVGANVSEGFFDVLGVDASLGRVFLDEENRPGRDRVVVLSHRLWASEFGAAPDVVGRTIVLDDEQHVVAGVMPAGFAFPNRAVQLWSPLALDLQNERRGNHYLYCIGRLAPDATVRSARAEMDAISRRLARDYPDSNTNVGVELVLLQDEIVGQARPALIILLTAVALVLLIACANVVNLLLARTAGRQREIAIRSALGASRIRLIRQFLTESLLMALLGGALGVLAAQWGVEAFLAAIGGGIPRAEEIAIDSRVLLFSLGTAVFAGLLCGLAPAWFASPVELGDSLKESGRGATAGRRRRRLHGALVVTEVALALLLLVGGGLLTRSFVNLQQTDPGFETDSVLTFQLSLPLPKYPEGRQHAAFFSELLQRVRAIPGVRQAGATRGLPFAGSRSGGTFGIPGRPAVEGEPTRHADVRLAGPGFFEALGIPLLAGRAIRASDDADAPFVVVINRTMADRFWSEEDPIGRRLTSGPDHIESEIVGVVGDTMQESLATEPAPSIYLPYRQHPHYKMSVVVRTDVGHEALVPALRAAVREVDPQQPIYGLATMRERVSWSISTQRFSMSLLGIFAASAVLLALIGVYGVLSYTVSRRTHEIGVRMALGASRADVLRLVVVHGVRLCLGGVVIGVVGALGLTRALASQLFGVTATDPVTFLATSVLVVVAGILASAVPAMRASRVDPLDALRCE